MCSLKELQATAKIHKIKGIYKMSKQELFEILRDNGLVDDKDPKCIKDELQRVNSCAATRKDLRAIAKFHHIKGLYKMSKQELFEVLSKEGVIEYSEDQSREEERQRLKRIRTNPKTVILKDLIYDKTYEFPSIYSAARFAQINPGTIKFYDGKEWMGKYFIKIE